jgi:hypothetical protein
MIIEEYFKEIRFLRSYILPVTFLLVLIWTLHFILTKETLIELEKEDGFFEWLTVTCFLISSILLLLSFIQTKNILYLLFGFIFFIGVGEEISWGYRILHYDLPDSFQKLNVSKEFNIHNLEIFNSMDLNKQNKHGLERLLEIEFIFKIITLIYGVVLPILVYHIKQITNFTMRIKLPIPPVSLGLFFIVNYLAYKFCSFYLINGIEKLNNDDVYSFVETFECIEAVLFLAISFYFYNMRYIIVAGKDIKQTIRL